jgi:hypothetical protein
MTTYFFQRPTKISRYDPDPQLTGLQDPETQITDPRIWDLKGYIYGVATLILRNSVTWLGLYGADRRLSHRLLHLRRSCSIF